MRIESIVRWTLRLSRWHLPDSTAPADRARGGTWPGCSITIGRRMQLAGCGKPDTAPATVHGLMPTSRSSFHFRKPLRFREFSAGKKAA